MFWDEALGVVGEGSTALVVRAPSSTIHLPGRSFTRTRVITIPRNRKTNAVAVHRAAMVRQLRNRSGKYCRAAP